MRPLPTAWRGRDDLGVPQEKWPSDSRWVDLWEPPHGYAFLRTRRPTYRSFAQSTRKKELRHPEDLSCVWIFHSGSGSKGANVDVTPFWQIRTCDHAFPAWDRNSIGHIAFCLVRRRN